MLLEPSCASAFSWVRDLYSSKTFFFHQFKTTAPRLGFRVHGCTPQNLRGQVSVASSAVDLADEQPTKLIGLGSLGNICSCLVRASPRPTGSTHAEPKTKEKLCLVCRDTEDRSVGCFLAHVDACSPL